MTKRMLIDAAHAEETRVVVVDGNRIEELDFESSSKKQLRGNIYLAKVVRVEPSLQAAFVEYGGNRHGFLAFNEIHPDYFQIPIADREALMREAEEDDDDDHAHTEADGAPESSGDEDEMDEAMERRRRRLMRRYKIQEVIKRRQIMLIQVVKEERGNKGAALTTYLSLAGRYGVLMPNTARGGGISRKITTVTDRKRLKAAVQSLEVPAGMGLIVRTAGASRTKAEIKRDYEYLMRLWEDIRDKTLNSIAPALIYEEEDLVKRSIRDLFDKDLDSIQVEGDAGYREARDFMRMIMPAQAKKVVHYREPTPLFVKHKVEDQISQIHSPVVQLKSGGYLVINQTEALVAVDVNSGRATRERNIEATALKTNMEAAEEAARQLRLRDLAGLIVIDFIDMDEGKNNRAVEKKLKDCLKDDRARIQMGKISGFGLMEISRQRRRSGVLEGSTHVCEHCQGTGRVRSVESSALSAVRALEMEAVKGGAGAVTLRLPTSVALYVLNEKRAYLQSLDAKGLTVTIAIDDSLAGAEVGIDRTETREGEVRAFAPAAPEPEADTWVAPVDDDEDEEDSPVRDDPEDEDAPDEARSAPAADRSEGEDQEGGAGRPRRRRRRGGRKDGDRPLPARTDAAETGSDGDDEGEEDADGADGADGERPGAPMTEAEREAGRRRRRRRGRRGGRRTREEGEAQTGDTYAWGAAHAPGEPRRGDDPYVWKEGPASSRPEVESAPQQVADPLAVQTITAEPLPLTDEPRRPRRRVRSRPGTEAPVEAVVEVSADTAPGTGASEPSLPELGPEVAAEPVAAETAEPATKPKRVRKKAGPVSAEAETESKDDVVSGPVAATPAPKPRASKKPAPKPDPVAGSTPEPAPAPSPAPALAEPAEPNPAERDPAEIGAPPPAPKRGWWRLRG